MVLALAASGDARADTDYFGNEAPKEGVTFKVEGSRTRTQRIWLGGLGGATALAGGLGLYFHLDSRDASNEVSTSRSTLGAGYTYTLEREATRERALRSRNIAIGAYAVGGVLLVSTIVALVKTQPASAEVRVRSADPATSVVPLPGGAFAARTWSF